MKLNSAQREAVEYLDGPLLVLAGPGTGKTQLLSHKVAYILEHTDTNPENILCITFTESGTANMRDRLQSIIQKSANKVHISTYHAFGTDVLYEYQQYSTELTRKLDDAISEVNAYKIIKDILKDLPPRDILKNDNIKDIIETISEAKSARLTSDDLAKIAEHNELESASLNAELAPVLALTTGKTLKFDTALNEVYRPLGEILAKHTTDKPVTKHIEPLANHLARTLNEAITTELAKDKPSTSPPTKWRNANFELDDHSNWRLKNIVANKKLASLASVMTKYQAHLEKHGLYDFDDMIELAIQTLKKDRGFRLSLSEKYQYILLDEFQDTNPAQFELIKLLTDYEKPNIMAVGDDDQAIFAFQGANVSNLLNFAEHYGAKTIVLTENYRNTQDILDLSRHIADQLDESFAKNHQITKNLTAKNPLAPNTIERHSFPEANAEYAWIAEQIQTLIKDGENPSDIAIIAPKHKYIALLLPHCKNYNIPIAYEKKDNIFDDPAIQQLIKLARFVHELASEKQTSHLALEILSFPFWELNPLTAIKITHKSHIDKRPILETLSRSDDPIIIKIRDFITGLITQAYDAPLELFLDYLIGTATMPDHAPSPFLNYYKNCQTDYDIYQLYNYLHVLRDACIKHTKNPTPHLKDFITFVDDYEEAEYPLINTSPYQTASQSVQIMSAHKAKGLEFKYVFLIAVDDRAWGNSKGNNNMLSLPKNLIQIRHTGATDDECIRLFFVAITRTKSHLYLTSSAADFSGKTTNSLEYLNEHDDTSPFLPDKHQTIIKHDHLSDQLPQTLHAGWVAAYQKLDASLKDLLIKSLENYRLTATDLTSFIDLKYAGPQVFYQNRILRAPQEPPSTHIVLGNLIHSVFEKVTKEKIDDKAAIEYFEERLDEQPLTAENRAEILASGTHALEVSLKKFGVSLRAPTAMSEVDFRSHRIQAGDIPITGKIDHMQIDKTHKIIDIYDFKTGNHHAPGKRSGWQSNLSLFKYSLQLEFYKLLLKNSPEYGNYQIKSGHILFINPSREDNAVYDETYDFTDDSAAKFIQLAEAIYRQIKTLNFVNDPELNLPPDLANDIKEIKEFITLLLAKSTKIS